MNRIKEKAGFSLRWLARNVLYVIVATVVGFVAFIYLHIFLSWDRRDPEVKARSRIEANIKGGYFEGGRISGCERFEPDAGSIVSGVAFYIVCTVEFANGKKQSTEEFAFDGSNNIMFSTGWVVEK